MTSMATKKSKGVRVSDRFMEGVAIWCAFYRANIHRFAEDYLHIDLRFFQKVVLFMMNTCRITVFIASRGLGKSYLSAVFCVCRCILYPGTKICIASGTRGQGMNVLEKIDSDLKPNSPELRGEIDEKATKINGTDAKIMFKNGSFIKVVTAGDSARGNRANILLLDEARLIKKDVIDVVLRKFLTFKRMPRYSELTKAGNLSIPLISKLWTSVESNQSTIRKFFTLENMLHYFILILSIYTDSLNAIFKAEFFDQCKRFSG